MQPLASTTQNQTKSKKSDRFSTRISSAKNCQSENWVFRDCAISPHRVATARSDRDACQLKSDGVLRIRRPGSLGDETGQTLVDLIDYLETFSLSVRICRWTRCLDKTYSRRNMQSMRRWSTHLPARTRVLSKTGMGRRLQLSASEYVNKGCCLTETDKLD